MKIKLLTVIVGSLCLAMPHLCPAWSRGGGPGGGPRQTGTRPRWSSACCRICRKPRAKADEWKIIEPRLKTVMEKQRAVRELSVAAWVSAAAQGPVAHRRRLPALPRRPMARADKAPKAAAVAAWSRPAGPRTAEITAVRRPIDAGRRGIKTALEALRKARTTREADLAKARDALARCCPPSRKPSCHRPACLN